MEILGNPVVYFEIPVTNMERAMHFYHTVFGFEFELDRSIEDNEMAYFPFKEDKSGISGALAKGEIYVPTRNGVLIYFMTLDIDRTLERSTASGATILFPKTSNDGTYYVAEIEDTEGNRIGLHMQNHLIN